MSHTVSRKSAIRSLPALQAVCVRLGLVVPVVTGTEAVTYMNVRWPWQQTTDTTHPTPIRVNLATGEASYDGDFTTQINAFLAQVVVEQHRQAARKAGYQVKTSEQTVKGKKKLVIEIEA